MSDTTTKTEKPTKEEMVPLVMRPYMAARLCNCSERHAHRMIEAAKKGMGKEPHQLLTVYEFMDFYGLKEKEALPYLKISYWLVFAMAVVLYFLRDDMQLVVSFALIWLIFRPRINKSVRKNEFERFLENIHSRRASVKSSRAFFIYPLATILLSLSSFNSFNHLKHAEPAWKFYGSLLGGIIFGVMSILGVLAMFGVFFERNPKVATEESTGENNQ
jgi:hypothetical protein